MTDLNFSFPAQLRLTTPADYQAVFARAIKSSDRYFTLLAIHNQLGHPRLGLAIAKKSVKHATDRNTIKRMARESFRLQQHTLHDLDIVVLARKEAGGVSAQTLRKSFDRLVRQLVTKCAG